MQAATPTPLPPRVSRAASVAQRARGVDRSSTGAGPGERIATKEELRERFGVAVATINEAVRLLETRGVIEARPGPGGGIFVARAAVRIAMMHTVLGFPSESTSYREYLVVRDALEPLICRDAARAARRRRHRRSRGDRRAHGARTSTIPPRTSRCNWELHRRLARITPNAPLRGIYLTLVSLPRVDARRGRDRRVRRAGERRDPPRARGGVADGPGPRLEAAIAAHTPLPPLGGGDAR